MAAAGATTCPTSIGSLKSIKNWREAMKYLHSSVERTRFLRKSGSAGHGGPQERDGEKRHWLVAATRS